MVLSLGQAAGRPSSSHTFTLLLGPGLLQEGAAHPCVFPTLPLGPHRFLFSLPLPLELHWTLRGPRPPLCSVNTSWPLWGRSVKAAAPDIMQGGEPGA